MAEKVSLAKFMCCGKISVVCETDNLFAFYYFDYFDSSRRQLTFIPKRAFKTEAQLADFRNAIAAFNRSLKVVSVSSPHHFPDLGSDRPHLP